MNFKAFSIHVILRVLLLVAVIFLFVFSWHQHEWYVTTSVLGLCIPVLTVMLIRYTHHHKKKLSSFLVAIQNSEYSSYQKGSSQKQSSLDHAFSIISNELKNVSIEKEAHYHYLQAMVENINTGIVSYEREGTIHIFNKAAARLFKIPVPRHLEALNRTHPSFYETLLSMHPGDRQLLNLSFDKELVKVAVQLREFRQHGKIYRIISLQDIRAELNTQELQSYQKLIQVLRHEIMNSATPIASLSEALKDSVAEIMKEYPGIDAQIYSDLQDLLVSSETIHTRTKGLLRFIQQYRKLTNIPEPLMEEVHLKEVVHHSLHLLKQELEKNSISIQTDFPDNQFVITGDFDQIEQVLINLLVNAIDAVRDMNDPHIYLEGNEQRDGLKTIRITDNGKGIDEEEMEKVFIPFYTTKEHGSGIGLSLVRQILKMHKGEIQLFSRRGSGTTCEILFY